MRYCSLLRSSGGELGVVSGLFTAVALDLLGKDTGLDLREALMTAVRWTACEAADGDFGVPGTGAHDAGTGTGTGIGTVFWRLPGACPSPSPSVSTWLAGVQQPEAEAELASYMP